MRVLAVLLVLLIGRPFAASADRRAVPVEGPSFQAEFASIEPDWNIVFATETEPHSLPAADLVRWGAPREFLRGPVVVLADGGLLAAEVAGIDPLNLEAESALFGPLTVPLDQVAGIVFQLPADPRRQTLLFDRALGDVKRGIGRYPREAPEDDARKGVPIPSPQADRIILENGDELTGLLDRLDAGRVRLRTDAGPIEADRRTVAAVIFNPALTRPARPDGLHAWAGLSDGSLVRAARIALDERQLTVTTLPGQTWTTLSDDLVFMQPAGGRVAYLSTIEPDGYSHTPYLELKWPYRLDRSVTGGRLRCAGRVYLTGLGVHSAARLTYRLDGTYDRFQSEVGIDDATAGRGSVRFRVFLDGDEQFTSDPIRGGEPPESIDVDLTGAKRLELVVDFAERAHVLDHANWLDARLVKPPSP